MSCHSMKIGSKAIGYDQPIFLVIETGTTANGDMLTAKKMCDAVKESGADAIKFQTVGVKEMMSDRNVEYKYATSTGAKSENMFEMLNQLQFTEGQWRELADYCKKIDLIFFSSTDYYEGVDLLENLGVPAHKLSSWDMTYYGLIEKMGRTKKPMLVDLGPGDLEEIIKLKKENAQLLQLVGEMTLKLSETQKKK